MENKILVNLYVPFLEKKYELFIPVGKKIGEVIFLISKALNDITGGYYEYNGIDRLYNKDTGKEYNVSEDVKHTNIRNGSDLILM